MLAGTGRGLVDLHQWNFTGVAQCAKSEPAAPARDHEAQESLDPGLCLELSRRHNAAHRGDTHK